MRPLGKEFAKVRSCGSQFCEFSFKENNLINIFSEVRRQPEIARFLLETAYLAFVSYRAADLTEPFPTFLLHNREKRPDAGNLEYILRAQQEHKDVKSARQVNKLNKNMDLGLAFIRVLYGMIDNIGLIRNENDFRDLIIARTKQHFKQW